MLNCDKKKDVILQYSPQCSFHPARIYPDMCTCYEVVKLHRYLQCMFESFDRYTYDLNVHLIVNFGGGFGNYRKIELRCDKWVFSPHLHFL